MSPDDHARDVLHAMTCDFRLDCEEECTCGEADIAEALEALDAL